MLGPVNTPAAAREPAHGRERLLAVATVAASLLAAWVVVPLVTRELRQPWRLNFGDLRIYRDAARATLSGANVYGPPFSAAPKPFTYPPFALLAVSWLAALPLHAAEIVAILASLAMLGVCCAVLARQGLSGGGHLPAAADRSRRLGVAAVALVLFAAGAFVEPVRSTLGFGQINLFLLALVLVDAFVVPSRFRGLLTGIAAAVKLTPAVFVVYFVLTGQWRAAGREAAAAGAVTLLTALALPRESWRYWSVLVWQDRQGPTTFAGNQNWTGLVTRPFGSAGGATIAVAVLDLLTLAVAVRATRRAATAGYPLTALAAVAVAGLLISPISWSHHWVWVVVMIAALALENPFRGAPIAAAGVLIIFHVALQHRLAGHDAHHVAWNGWESIAGNSYTLTGFAFLVAVAFGTRPGRVVPRRVSSRTPR